ncbi:Phage integrase [Candidatus Terasakiella magnetica]|uniref:Phage integrase n=1 Tax=Candidatus Terasakiella magnetica TaxID=1867952 RepID=A0A1C3RF62_9PROT|nr:site-specific integrase [Candidatus Terasakiella magnetica]SCA55898.1 Phage integrase [Candidatus Terasakiella magnetica]
MPGNQKITDKFVKNLKAPATGNVVTYDTDISGFGIRITHTGHRAFVLTYRFNGPQKRLTIGQYPTWSVSAAREEAKYLKREIAKGFDPLADKIEKREAPTVNDLWEKYQEEHLPTKAERAAKDDASMWKNYILPKFRKTKLASITADQIDKFHREISIDKPVRANRIIEVFRKAFNLAIRWEWVSNNPCSGVKKNNEEPRQRYATDSEITAITDVMRVHKEQTSCDAIRMLLLTGARKTEVLKARWQDIDLEQGVWIKPSAHTKQRKFHRVPLASSTVELLKKRNENNDTHSQWVFEGVIEGNHLTDIKNTWKSIRERSTVILWREDPRLNKFMISLDEQYGPKLTCKKCLAEAETLNINMPVGVMDLRMHDLRHTFASILASSGQGLLSIGALLGHTQQQTTQRYSHLFDEPLREAVNIVGSKIA